VNGTLSFCGVSINGNADTYGASNSIAFALCFRIG
jgi:hypothetical protein